MVDGGGCESAMVLSEVWERASRGGMGLSKGLEEERRQCAGSGIARANAIDEMGVGGDDEGDGGKRAGWGH